MNAGLGANSAGELMALLKRNPGKYNYASIGTGSLSHLAMEAIALQSGTRLVHIPYASSPQAMTAIIRGDAQLAILASCGERAQTIGLARNGKACCARQPSGM